MIRTLRPVGILLAVAALALAGCSNSNDSGSDSASGAVIPAVTDNGPDSEPLIAMPSGNPPAKLVIKDLVVGTGTEALATSSVTVHYTGLSWSNGQTFDSSWLRGEPVTFSLAGNLIEGWKDGVPGMKVGGRRLLVIPPDKGYGVNGSGPIAPNETLVFVIDLKAVQ